MNLPTYITSNAQTKAYRLLKEHVYSVLDEYDLTPSHWSMLGIIAEARDGVRQVEVAHTMHVKPPFVTAIGHQLQGRGLITRVANQFDARAKLIALTPEGKKFMKTVEAALSSHLNVLLAGLTDAELTTYHKVLTTIIANDKAYRRSVK
ncbi:MAG: hypothetical protein NVS1B10_02520 [Candidatus Saccharimonadales bacterium]